jgi:large subunit ribosomal protein L10
MKNKPEKQKDLESLRADLEKAQNVFLTGYEKLTVAQDFALRKTIRGAGAGYKVIKNRIAEKAAEGTAKAELLKDLRGMCSIAFTSGDPVALAKALTAYAKENPSFTFKAGLVEGRVVDVTGITALATLPSKEEIFSKLLYVINAPAQQLVTAMNGVGRNLAVVVDQGVKENKFAGEGTPA